MNTYVLPLNVVSENVERAVALFQCYDNHLASPVQSLQVVETH